MWRVLLVLTILSIYGCKEKQAIDIASIPESSESFNETNKDRAAWQKPSLVIQKLGDLSGKTVADIGAGTGYFAFRLAFKAEQVIAIEIDTSLIELMEGIKLNLPVDIQNRFETRLAKADDPLLRDDEVDLVVIINTITYIENHVNYLRTVYDGLNTGGQIMVLDFKPQIIPIESVPDSEDLMSSQEIEEELKTAGFVNIRVDSTTLDYQYMIFAEKA